MSDLQFLMPPALRGKSSIYEAMSKAARVHNAADLAQGFPNIDGPKAVREYAAKLLLDGPQQYTDPRGLASLRAALVEDTKKRYQVDLDQDEQVTITAGAQDALGAAMLGLLQAGDEVIFIEPFYNPMVPLARLSGATLKFVSLQGDDFHLDESILMESMSERTKLIVYNSPNNPSGHVFLREELMMMARACEQFDAYLLADEVYEHLVYAGHKHVSALEVPELAERCVVVSSFSKTYLMTGWRVGWALGAPALVAGIGKIHELMSFCLPAFVSEGARFALQELPSSYLDEFAGIHQRKRDALCAGLRQAGLNVNEPDGTFFCSMDIRELGETDDLDFCLRLPKEVGVAAVPMSLSWNQRLHGRHLIRLCFSKTDETLEQALRAWQGWMVSRR